MSKQDIYALSELAAVAQTAIQQDFDNVDPVIGINRRMRKAGFPADAMTIDSVSSTKRIIVLLHDDKPGDVSYQFSYKDKDPGEKFSHVPFEEVTVDKIYSWIKVYFVDDNTT